MQITPWCLILVCHGYNTSLLSFCVCMCHSEPLSGRGRLTRRKSQPPLRQRERVPCHNLWLKKHEFFSAQWQRWHFMFTTIISLVNDSCGCGAYESFREQTETLMLRALNSFTGRCFNSQTEFVGIKQRVKWVWEYISFWSTSEGHRDPSLAWRILFSYVNLWTVLVNLDFPFFSTAKPKKKRCVDVPLTCKGFCHQVDFKNSSLNQRRLAAGLMVDLWWMTHRNCPYCLIPGLDVGPIVLPTVADPQLQSAPSKTRPNLAAVCGPEPPHIWSPNTRKQTCKCVEPQSSGLVWLPGIFKV